MDTINASNHFFTHTSLLCLLRISRYFVITTLAPFIEVSILLINQVVWNRQEQRVEKSWSAQIDLHLELDYLNWLLVKWLILASLPPPTLDEHWLLNSFRFLKLIIKLWLEDKFQTVLSEVYSERNRNRGRKWGKGRREMSILA